MLHFLSMYYKDKGLSNRCRNIPCFCGVRRSADGVHVVSLIAIECGALSALMHKSGIPHSNAGGWLSNTRS